MRKIWCLSLLVILLAACHDSSEPYGELPQSIREFITDYWPDPVIDSYTQPSSDLYVVIIKDGPKLTFDGNFSWTQIDGCGMPLPEILLDDQLPEKLYEYLEGGEYLNQVFDIRRDSKAYYLTLENTDLTYSIADGKITEGPLSSLPMTGQ